MSDSDSGPDLIVCEFEPRIGLSAVDKAYSSSSVHNPPPSLCPSPLVPSLFLSLSLSLSKINLKKSEESELSHAALFKGNRIWPPKISLWNPDLSGACIFEK